MSDPIDVNRRNWDERARIHLRDATGFYGLDRLRAGFDVLGAIEARDIGDVDGKRVLHLQCHIGTDSISLARRGAVVVGLDFSPVAIASAEQLARESGPAVTFIEGRVEDAARLTPGPFDLVYTSWGTICWLPDLVPWARAIAAVLRRGGAFYLADAHPSLNTLDLRDGVLRPVYDFRTPHDTPLQFTNATTYTGDPTVMEAQDTREWIHPLSAILTALLDAGLQLTMFREHEKLPWPAASIMVEDAPGLWRLPDGHPRLPLSFSLRAIKPL